MTKTKVRNMKGTQQGTLKTSPRYVDLKQVLSRFQQWWISISRSLPLKRTRLPPSLGIHRDFYQQHQPSPTLLNIKYRYKYKYKYKYNDDDEDVRDDLYQQQPPSHPTSHLLFPAP